MKTADQANDSLEKQIFLEAVQKRTAGERTAFLDVACSSNARLRKGVEELLSLYSDDDRFMSVPAANEQAPVAASPGPGTPIGRYRTVEKIGEGGCGIVYEAEQLAPVRRPVALKLIKAGMDTKAVIARFEAERQALAMMDHPNIAKVFDAGSTEEGRPYFVMELVNGVKITDFCLQHNLPIRDRLNLFLQVCDAVQHAHQKGIIHRDLKPSNILVGSARGGARILPGHSDALPKVIDFGIAKAIEGKLTDATNHTGLHQFMGTPAYMSPEQADLSPDIDTRTDIYSLGALLYELLTGKPPFDNHELLTAGVDEMRRIIREVEPRPPSHFSLGSQRLSLPSDLDWIVMKCLEKERSCRYDTAGALSADIQHHLNNEPVLARPQSAAYRLEKFVRRNKIQFAAGTVVVFALLTAVAVSSRQAIKAKRAEQTALRQTEIATQQTDLARQESDKAQVVRDYLIENLLGVDCCGASPDAEALTFEATQALVKKVARNLDGRFTNQPLSEAEIRMALVKSLHSSRDYAESVLQAEKAFEIRRQFLGLENTNTLESLKALAFAKYMIGRKDEALSLLTNGMNIARVSAGGTNKLSPVGVAITGAYWEIQSQGGQAKEALPYLTETISAARQFLDPKSVGFKSWVAKLIMATQAAGDVSKAEEMNRDLYRQCLIDQGPDHPFTLNTEFALGRLLVYQRKWQEAIPLLQSNAAKSQAKIGTNNFSTLNPQLHLGEAFEQKGDIEAAASIYRDVYPRYAQYLPYSSAVFCCNQIANFFVRHRYYDDAKTAFVALRRTYETTATNSVAEFERYIAAVGASSDWNTVVEICRTRFDLFPESYWLWLNKAWIFRFAGDDEQYRRLAKQVLALPTAQLSTNDLHLPLEIASLGPIDFTPQEIADIDARIKHVELIRPNRGPNEQLWSDRAIAQMQLRLHRPEKALAAIEQALRQSPSDAYALYLKAASLHHLGRHSDARRALSDAQTRSKEQLSDFVPPESFMRPGDLYQHLVMRRETQALITGKDESPR